MTSLPKAWQSWRAVPEKDPKRLSKLVEAGCKLRAKRKALEAEAEVIRKEERALKDFLLEGFDKSALEQIKTKAGTAELSAKTVPQAEDWNAIYTYIAKHKAYDLLQKRLHERACAERWEAGEAIPGVKQFKVLDIKFGEE